MASSDRFFSSSWSPNKSQELRITNMAVPYMPVAYHQSIIHDDKCVSTQPNDYMDGFRIEHEKKLKDVSEILRKAEDSFKCLIMIDALQRLAIDYHFQEEIEAILSRQYSSFMASGGLGGDDDLYNVSLCFRLLRQDGYHVPADVFKNFKDKDGEFKVSLSEDIRGMMGLYEASQLGIEGENILDEAIAFASKHLNASVMHLEEDDLVKDVNDTLDYPYHKNLARFKTKHYIKNFEQADGTNSVLKEIAKMDFNIVQSLHQRELLQVTKWWRDLGLAQELKFARDQPIKWYVWSMATLTDPKFSEQRIELTKPISLIYIIDDIFDVYGTLEELVHFTEAINKWELTATEHLPNYMKISFKAIYDITKNISHKVLTEHGWNPIDSLRKTWASLCNAFLVEAKWFASGHMPEAEVYLQNGVISSGVNVVLVHMFFLLGQGINKESVDRVDNIPGLISCPATILRLWDDLGSAKDEKQEGYDGSYVDCYMKDHGGSTIENAREHVVCMISNTWKRLNKECLSTNSFSPSFTKGALNAARMVRVMYSYDDNQGLPTLAEHIKSLIYESIPL